MSLQAGFAEIDITPPVGTHKIGWLKDIVCQEVLSPLFARVAVFQSGPHQVAFVQLDTLFIAWPEVAAIRQGVGQAYGFEGQNVMVSATHNHAGPAVTHTGDVPKDEGYATALVSRVVEAFGQALARSEEAEVGSGSCFEWRVAHNRRVVMRDGTAHTHGRFTDPDALCLEGPVDPEVGVIAARDKRGNLLGALINFSCHPTHHGGDGAVDAGYPGVLAREMHAWGCPATLFLNGASGNLHTADPCAGGKDLSAEEAGHILAQDAQQVIQKMSFQKDVPLAAASCLVSLPYRQVTDDEIAGRVRGAQRFIDPAIYDRTIPLIVQRIGEQNGAHPAEVQALFLGDWAVVGMPAELFVELGLRIKERAHPLHALVSSCTNGRVGYVPTGAAFAHGGYETTFGPSSMLAPQAGDLLVEAAARLVAQQAKTRKERP